VALDRLADTPLAAVELHGTLNLEGRRVRGVAGDADEDHPLLVVGDAVVDDLGTGECCMAVEDLLRRRCRVGNAPVVDGGVGDHADDGLRHPFPEDDVLVVHV
jgi:hypothetical protein